MSTDVQRHDLKPPQPTLDEGYWSALLREGEHATTVSLDIPSDGECSEFDHSVHDELIDIPDEVWQEIIDVNERDQVVELLVVGYNRGGLLVEWHSVRGFVPASQLVDFPATHYKRNSLTDHVGQTLKLRVIELDAEKNRLILSERAALARPGSRDMILNQLEPGDIVEGTVTNLCDFGAFVDLGGLEGLIHISELSWGRVGHPNSILRRGQSVQVYVLGVDSDQGRIALSVKRLHPDPWKTVSERYSAGQLVEGVITNVVDFGAFACIEDGLEGLIHVSELAEGHFLHPRNVVSEGQHIRARILTISGEDRRLGLSLRLAT